MLFILFLIVCSFIGTSFLGYWVHWAFHQNWAGPFYRSHQAHHLDKYPPGDFYSEKYRSAELESSAIWMPVVFSPFIIGLIISMVLGWISVSSMVAVLGTAIIVGLLHSYIHDAFHLTSTWWSKCPGFAKWRAYHEIHHVDMQKNLGIFLFGFDRIFNTFQK